MASLFVVALPVVFVVTSSLPLLLRGLGWSWDGAHASVVGFPHAVPLGSSEYLEVARYKEEASVLTTPRFSGTWRRLSVSVSTGTPAGSTATSSSL